MIRNVKVFSRILQEVRGVGDHASWIELLGISLRQYVQYRRQLRILGDFGTVDFDREYDYKAERRRKRCGSDLTN